MLAPTTQLGSTTQGTTFADIIINTVGGVADGNLTGFASFVHDPKALKRMVESFLTTKPPNKFADAVVIRRAQTQAIDDIWRFPLNMSVPTSCPLPWTLIEATVRTQQGNTSWEYNIMRTADFIGRNYIKITLPEIDTTRIRDSAINENNYMADPEHIYLGAWFRDLIPRLIQQVSFYPRANSHKLFEYTGYDIYIHNILFGNANKEMNDLMAGEDKFELCYDPYRVDGSALGMSSYKGIDYYKEFQIDSNSKYLPSFTKVNQIAGNDNFIDYFQLDTTMSGEQFREIYRHNVYYETPIAMNYNARHSIHSHRMFHRAKDIIIPLDILPFGYSIESSLPAAALSGECGFIKVTLFSDWLDRSFYLTKLSDCPALHPIPQHTHYAENDAVYTGTDEKYTAKDAGLTNWVNPRSLGQFGNPEFSASSIVDDETEQELNKRKYALPGNIVDGPSGIESRENIIPTAFNKDEIVGSKIINYPTGRNGKVTSNRQFIGQQQGVTPGFSKSPYYNVNRTPTSQDWKSAEPSLSMFQFLHKLSTIDYSYYTSTMNSINVKLLQVGYYSLQCIRELLSKLPNIYITCEWDDQEKNINETSFDINNDLYIQAIILWFIPVDPVTNIESMRVYPCHMVDHEYPIIPGLKIMNEQSQGTCIYSWDMLNVLNPAQMGLSPLLENIGIISFSPRLAANTLPYAYYDQNVSGYCKVELKQGEGNSSLDNPVNLTSGKLKVISIGVNGCASVNLNVHRLIF